MKNGLLLIAAFFIMNSAYSQTPNNITIKGLAADTLDEPLSFSTVMLLSPKDSTLLNFTSANNDGEFRFSNIKNSDYLLKISHMNYMPYQKFIARSETAIIDLGTIKMSPIDQTLMEVVIQAARAPLFIRGDTIEYDVATFKVPPGSTVEDLLRRLPGIEVDGSGNISSQGEAIRRVYVDGKRFFGDDPKSATKNLGAEVVSKVQVFDEKTEQARLTGIDDGDFDRAMNLELRQEFKTGKFGKATVGAGTLERLVASANYNRFSTKNQLSFIGYANNINQTGVNWEDYGQFLGSNAFRQFDTGDFGFENRRGGRHSVSFRDAPISFDDGMGLTKNFGSGVNYNFDDKGTKLSTSYFYNQTGRNYEQVSSRQTFLDEQRSFDQQGFIESESFRFAHSAAGRFEREFNPSDRLIMTANFRFTGNDNNDINDQLFYDFDNSPVNNLLINNGSELTGFNLSSLAIYRHLFSKKGRSFAVSAAYNQNKDDGSDKLNTINEFFSLTTPTEQILQSINNDINAREIKSSILYSEPLSNRIFAELFYNFSNTTNDRNRQATAPLMSVPRIDSLSIYYTHNTLYNRIGSLIRYSHNEINAALGLAGESLIMDGKNAPDKNMEWTTRYDTRTYNNLTPYASITYNMRRTFRLSLNYSSRVSVPDFNQMYPVLNTSNPSYQVMGNPELVPEISDRISLSARYWNRASFSNINFRATYSIDRNPIVYNQFTEVIPGKGFITISMPENMEKGRSYNMWLWSNIPIIKTVLTTSLSGGYTGSDSPTRINSVLDNIISNSFNLSASVNYTPDPGLILTVGAGGRITDVAYSVNESQDQDFYDYSVNSSIKWQFEKKTFFESNFNYNVYANDRFGFNQSLPLWNASIRRLFGKQNRFEMRLAAFDILNKNVTISQFAVRNYVQSTETNTLTRYIMLSMTYNIRGFEARMERNRMWF